MFSPFQPDAVRIPVDEESEIVPFGPEKQKVAIGTDGRTVGIMLRAPAGVVPREQMWRVRRVLRPYDTGRFELVVDSQLMMWKRVPAEPDVVEVVLRSSAALREGLGDALRDVLGGQG